jgi:predicted aconitase
LHTDAGRRATLVVELDLPAEILQDDIAYPLIGHALGRLAGNRVAAIVGLPSSTDEDRLKAVGAAAASSGAVAMFHAVGVTPEASTLDAATGGLEIEAVHRLDSDGLRNAWNELDTARSGRLGAVSVGTPHMSTTELRKLVDLADRRRSLVPFYVNTSRGVLDSLDDRHRDLLDAFGATIVTDTCTYISPIVSATEGDIMTNSGKWAFYAPANLGGGVMLGSLIDCVESAVAGRPVRSELWS